MAALVTVAGFAAHLWAAPQFAASGGRPEGWIHGLLNWPHPLFQQVLLATAAAVLLGAVVLINMTDLATGDLNTATNWAIGCAAVCLLPVLVSLVLGLVLLAVMTVMGVAVLAVVALIAVGFGGAFGD